MTATVLQIVVFCLTVTEWCAKMREEVMTYDLVGAMGNDFFTAFDVIEILMMPLHNEVVQTPWMFVVVVISFVAMFKYLPVPQESLDSKESRHRALIFVLFNLAFQEIPFLVVRIAIKIVFGLKVVELIYPAKNLTCVVMYLAQIYIIVNNSNERNKTRSRSIIRQQRMSRRENETEINSGHVNQEEVTSFTRRTNQRSSHCWPDNLVSPNKETDKQKNDEANGTSPHISERKSIGIPHK